MFKTTRILSSLAMAAALLLAAVSAMAAEPINTLEKKGLFGYSESGIAIRGYDTVAYFTLGKPVEGSTMFTYDWQGATWRFSSQEHLDLFSAEPTRYAPQYGGYCAYGVVSDALVKIEPDAWSIIDDKLYLNYDANVQSRWSKDTAGYIATADSKFADLLKSE